MKNALLAALGSMGFAATRGRVLLALLLAHFALALPSALLLADAVRGASNHHADPIAFAAELDYTAWFDLRAKLEPAAAALSASALAAFLFGIFSAGGWLEVLSHRSGHPGFRVFASGAGTRFVRYLRLALLSLLAIAGARWLFYGTPALALEKALSGGSGDLADFSTEKAANAWTFWRSLGFGLAVGLVVLVSDLGRAALVVRGGRSAVLAATRGLILFLRRPVASVSAAGFPFLAEMGILLGIAWLADRASEGEATNVNLAALLLCTQAAVVVREVTKAGRLGGLLAIAGADDDARFERRYGKQADPILAAAGGGGTLGEEYEG